MDNFDENYHFGIDFGHGAECRVDHFAIVSRMLKIQTEHEDSIFG